MRLILGIKSVNWLPYSKFAHWEAAIFHACVHGVLLQALKEKQTHSLCAAEADSKIASEEDFPNRCVSYGREEGGKQTMIVLEIQPQLFTIFP